MPGGLPPSSSNCTSTCCCPIPGSLTTESPFAGPVEVSGSYIVAKLKERKNPDMAEFEKKKLELMRAGDGPNPFVDAGALKAYGQRARHAFESALEKQRAQ